MRRRWLVLLAGWTALACLWRHASALYIAAPTIVLFLLRHDRGLAIRRGVLYAGLCAAFLAPWLLCVQWAGGLGAYVASAIRFVATEGQRTVVGSDDARQLASFVALMGIPIAAVVFARRSQDRLSCAPSRTQLRWRSSSTWSFCAT